MARRTVLAALLAGVLASGCGSGGTGGFSGLTKMLGGGGLDSPTIASGLKEALRVGTNNAVSETSRAGGYWNNLAIRVVMPAQLQKVSAALRKVGLGSMVDSVERKMNEAAEAAASLAAAIFIDAITQMTFEDAKAILMGGPTAATDFFRVRTGATLKARYMPVVAAKMRELGAIQAYDGMLAKYNAIPLAAKPELPRIEEYVTDKALEGLFVIVAREEKAIRENPAARTTELLRRVFGSKP